VQEICHVTIEGWTEPSASLFVLGFLRCSCRLRQDHRRCLEYEASASFVSLISRSACKRSSRKVAPASNGQATANIRTPGDAPSLPTLHTPCLPIERGGAEETHPLWKVHTRV